jgi:starch phosphorylase
MFARHKIDSITNGVLSPRWVCGHLARLYDAYIPGWDTNPFSLRYALSIPGPELWEAHQKAKLDFIELVNRSGAGTLDCDTLTIGFARRATAYKRADLVFFDIDRLVRIAEQAGKIQFAFAGKAHPADSVGKEVIRIVISIARRLRGTINIVWLDNYDEALAKYFVSGVDLWLNTPRKPQEASGTSGMKAAHNAVPSLSILDGWWIEGCIEGLTGWAIGTAAERENSDEKNARSLYEKLEQVVVPTFYRDRGAWVNIMRHSLSINASFFNTHRMMQEYVLKAYS